MSTRTNARLSARSVLAGALALALLAPLSACKNRHVHDPDGDPVVTSFESPDRAYAALQGDWRLVELDGRSVAEIYESAGLETGRAPGLSITPQGGMGGFAGVNRMAGTIDASRIAKGTIAFAGGGAAMTKMAGPPELMALEDAFARQLSEGRRIRLVNNRLTLLDDAENATAVLERGRYDRP